MILSLGAVWLAWSPAELIAATADAVDVRDVLMPKAAGSLDDGQTFVLQDGVLEDDGVAAHSSAEADAATVYLTSREGALRPGGRYRVQVRYRVVSQPEDRSHFLYVTVRGGKWFPLIELPTLGETSQENGLEFLTPDDGNTYHIEIGRRGSGEALIDAVQIEELPRVEDARRAGADLTGFTLPEIRAPYEPYGVCVHADRLWQYTDEEVERAVSMWAEAGIQWVRVGMGWVAFEPSEDGGWDEAQVARMDRLVALCAEHGVQPYAIVGGSPKWASSRPDHPKSWAFMPRDMDRFRAFMRYVTQRYGSQIKVWELGNEPNWAYWLDDMPSFMVRAKAAAEVIREEIPGATVLNGGWADAGLLGMRLGNALPIPDAMHQMAAEGFGDVFDAMAVHVYNDDPEEMIYRINQYYAQMQELGLAHLPMWVTETGFSTVGDRTEQQQAQWIRDTYELLLQHPCVEKVFYYNFKMKVRETKDGGREANFGIVDGQMNPRPGYDAYKAMPKRSTPEHDPALLAVDRWRLVPGPASVRDAAGN